jgi:hypothetical protein
MLDSQNRVVPDGIVISSGQGVTPSGELVLLPSEIRIRISDLEEEQRLDLNFGLGRIPLPPRRTRTGIYVLALRPVEFTANPIASYPTSIQGTRQTHDGDIVEATAIALIPYPDPVSNVDAALRRSALAYRIFAGQSSAQSKLNDALLPLAIVSVQRGQIEWLDEWLVRRVVSADYAGQQFGLSDPATQSAFFLQYDSQLQTILSLRAHSGLESNFSASQYFSLLPPAGRFPLQSLNVQSLTQNFFPQHLDVRLSIIPEDEVPALLEDSLDLPPLDLTLPPDDYTQLAVFALIPVARADFAGLKAKLTPTPLRPAVPQILAFRRPLELLRVYRGELAPPVIQPGGGADWSQAIGKSTLGFYLRRKSAPNFVDFTNA